MNDFFAELKRRNVVRVGIAYVVVAWAIAQVIDLAADNFAVPEWFTKMVLIILVLGLPIALILSWAYEMTPDGVKKTAEVDKSKSITPQTGQKLNKLIIGALALAVIVLLADRVWLSTEDMFSEAEAGQASIAVLPFVNMSGEASNEYFADGLSEEILNVLAKVPDLKVAGRTSSFQFKGENLDLRDIGSKLGVDHVLEGSVRKQGNRVRITAQLIRASDGFHIWSETYDRDLKDIFEVQDEISAAIFDALSVTLNLSGNSLVESPPTTNMVAYDRYLEAKTLLAKRGKTNLINAARNLEEATQLDPSFAEAWAVLAQVYSLAPYYQIDDASDFPPKAEAAGRRAIALKPDLGTGHAGLADALREQGKLIEAEAEYKRALALNPNEIEANSQYAQFLIRVGKAEEALPYALKSSELDPLSGVNATVVAMCYFSLGDLANEKVYMDRALALDTIGFPHMIAGSIALTRGDFDQARSYILKAATILEGTNFDGLIRNLGDAMPGRERTLDFLQSQFDQAKQSDAPVEFPFLFWHAAASYGDYALAFGFIENYFELNKASFDAQMYGIPKMRFYPPFHELIAKRSGFLEYWKANGFPKGCRAVGEEDFTCE